MAAAFPRKKRLLRPGEFERVFAQPRRYPSEGFVVLATGGACEYARLGVIVSRKSARRAVDRNRLKRIARESFRQAAATLPAVDVVVLFTRNAPSLTATRLRATLEQAWASIRSTPWAASLSHSSDSTNI